MKRLTTRSIATATAIRDREDFKTSGSLEAFNLPSTSGFYHSGGRLRGADLDQYNADKADIDYVVMSYATPIAWHVRNETTEGRWHRVAQKFSVTTSKHQGNLYMI